MQGSRPGWFHPECSRMKIFDIIISISHVGQNIFSRNKTEWMKPECINTWLNVAFWVFISEYHCLDWPEITVWMCSQNTQNQGVMQYFLHPQVYCRMLVSACDKSTNSNNVSWNPAVYSHSLKMKKIKSIKNCRKWWTKWMKKMSEFLSPLPHCGGPKNLAPNGKNEKCSKLTGNG